MAGLEVTADHIIPIGLQGGPTTVQVLSGATLNYSQSASMIVQGTITQGSSYTFTQPAWIWSTGLSEVGITSGYTGQLAASGYPTNLDLLSGSTLPDLSLVTGPNTTNFQVSGKLITNTCVVNSAASRLVFEVDADGSGMTANQNAIGIYNTAGTLVMQTPDLSTIWGSGATHAASIVTLPATLPPGFYYVAVLMNYSSVAPYLVGVSYPMGPDLAGSLNASLPARVAYSSGTYTSLPASINWSSAGFLSHQWNFVTWVGFLP